MEKKLTQKEQILKLKQENEELKSSYDKLLEVCQRMDRELSSLHEDIDEAFSQSSLYLQMKRRIEDLEFECKVLKERNNRRNTDENI